MSFSLTYSKQANKSRKKCKLGQKLCFERISFEINGEHSEVFSQSILLNFFEGARSERLSVSCLLNQTIGSFNRTGVKLRLKI